MNGNINLKSGKRILFAVFTQGLLSVAAIIVGFGLPKFLSIEEYSRWQVYYFYVAYVNYLQFGFNDGLVLNLSGTRYEELPWRTIKKATLVICLFLVAGSIAILGGTLVIGVDDFQVVKLLIYSFIPTILMCTFSAVLLAGNKTYEYNIFCLLIRVAFVVLLIIGILFDIQNADFYIVADILSKILIVIIFYLRERKYTIRTHDSERVFPFIRKNCGSGIIVASTVLILGLLPMCGRVVIQALGSTEEYARYSFAISMLSIILTFTNAIGTIAFPMLKNNGTTQGADGYSRLVRVYDEILWLCFMGLAVIEFIIRTFLIEYVPILDYFAILLAVCWPLGKIQCIVYPYYKLARREKEFLVISVACITFTFILSFGLYGLNGVTGLAWAALIGVMVCDIVLNLYYAKKVCGIPYEIRRQSLLMFCVFLVSSLFLGQVKFVVYGAVLIIHYIVLIIRMKRCKNVTRECR